MGLAPRVDQIFANGRMLFRNEGLRVRRWCKGGARDARTALDCRNQSNPAHMGVDSKRRKHLKLAHARGGHLNLLFGKRF